MTVTQRSTFLQMLLVIHLLVAVAVVVLLVQERPVLDREVVPALAGSALMTGSALGMAAVYLRVFRRSRSIPVFFMVLFLVFAGLDVTKGLQVLIAQSPFPHLGSSVSRVTIFGHLTGALALFGSGLYSGSHRLKWHGTALTLGLFLVAALTWVIPVDTAILPRNLVFPAGFTASLDALTASLFVLAVLSYGEPAVTGRSLRGLVNTGAVVLAVAGRELLYHRTEVASLVVGTVLFIGGTALYAAYNYRDYLVS